MKEKEYQEQVRAKGHREREANEKEKKTEWQSLLSWEFPYRLKNVAKKHAIHSSRKNDA